MKQRTTDLTQAMRNLVVLMLMVIGCGIMKAADETEIATSDDINTAILVDGSIPVYWTNDTENPWYVDGDTVLNDASMTEDAVSTLSFTYTSSYPVELAYQGSRNYNYTYYNEKLSVEVDGEEKDWFQTTGNSSWYYWESHRLYLPEGTHTVAFKNLSGSNPTEYYKSAGLRSVRVWECKELETQALTAESKRITFVNDPENPWIADDGFIKSNSSGNSSISTTFTIDRYATFRCTMNNGRKKTNEYLEIVVDGDVVARSGENNEIYPQVALEPGTHTVQFNRIATDADETCTTISNVNLYTKWNDITLTSPGDLGREILYQEQVLNDVHMLAINGMMNDDDWETISKISSLYIVDLRNTPVETIPTNPFSGSYYLSTVLFPETLKSIEDEAFKVSSSTNCDFVAKKFHIPSSVERIGNSVWENNSALREITFSAESNLKSIGYYAFRYCTQLKEFIMPNSVTTLAEYSGGSGYQFYECGSLEKLHFSDNVKIIPGYCAAYCTNLTEVKLPANVEKIYGHSFIDTAISNIEFPETLISINGTYAFDGTKLESVAFPKNLTYIGDYSFRNCKQLKEVTFNSHMNNLQHIFYGCTAVNKVICPCATPPTRYYDNYSKYFYDPFDNVTTSNIKLIVPDFALMDYKLDSYWRLFQVDAGDEASIADYWAIRGELNLSENGRIRNTPDIDMQEGSSMAIYGEAAQTFKDFVFNTSEGSPARYLSECDNVTANSVEPRFYIGANSWYFFTAPADINVADIKHSATTAFVIRTYNGGHRASENTTSGNWDNVTDGVLKRGQGYVMQANAAGWVSFPVPAVNHQQFLGNQEVTLDLNEYACETTANANWNFLGNPYPSYYDIYYIDVDAPITVWNGSGYRALSLRDDNYVLRPMQAFFVQKPESNDNAQMLRGGKQTTTTIKHGSGSGKMPAREPQQSVRELFDIELTLDSDSVASDMTRIVLNEAASLDYEINCDASKFMSLDQSVAQLYSIDKSGTPLAINERPYFDGNVRLGVYTPSHGEMYRIEAPRADRQVYLYDSQLGIEHDLTRAAYIFMAGNQSYDSDRFTLRFAPATTTVGNSEADTVRINAARGVIYVTAPEGASVSVYSTEGIAEASAVSSGTTLNFILDKGIYVVKVDGETFKTVVK